MRVAKILDTQITDKHGKYAEVLGLIDSPSGVKARLKFGDGHRETMTVRKLRMVQDENVPRSKDGWF
tara:strand:- start:130 stop:330 length:201 start_codon:yes stop_codon:yes gene_type:complete